VFDRLNRSLPLVQLPLKQAGLHSPTQIRNIKAVNEITEIVRELEEVKFHHSDYAKEIGEVRDEFQKLKIFQRLRKKGNLQNSAKNPN